MRRGRTVHYAFSFMVPHAATPIDTALSPAADPLAAFRLERFRARGRASFVAHLALVGIGTLVWVALPQAIPAAVAGLWPFLLALVLAAVASRLLLEHPWLGPGSVWLNLCLDAAILTALLTTTGGLFSPLLGIQPAVVGAFRLVLPVAGASTRATAILLAGSPAFVPLLVFLDGPLVPAELLLLATYGALGVAIWIGLGSLQRGEERSHARVLALEARLRRQAVEEERGRLSREIHDGVGAALASLVLQAEWGLNPGADAQTTVRHLKETAEEAVDDLRRSLRHLRDDFDLEEALRDHCATFQERHGLPVAWVVEGTARSLGPQADLTLFRLLQESLTNVLRHAEATRVEVRLGLSDFAELWIRDDGKGFDARSVSPGRFGLRGMRERALALGGSLSIDSGPTGTVVHLALPNPKERR